MVNSMHHNLAAVRLLLCQSCEKFELDEKLTLIFAPGGYIPVGQPSDGDVMPKEQPVEPRFKDLPFDSNDQVLKDIYVSLTDDPKLERLGNPATTLLFLREAKSNDNSSVPQEVLMDFLLEKANTIAKENEPKNGKKKPAERGFQGTLLSSIRSAPTGAPKDEGAGVKEEVQASGDPNKGDKNADLDPSPVSKGGGDKPPVEEAKVKNKTDPDPTLVSKGGGDKPLVEEAKMKNETKTKMQNGTKVGGESKAQDSVLEQVGRDRQLISSIAMHVQEMLSIMDEAKAMKAAQWAVSNGDCSRKEDLKAAAVERFLKQA